MIEPKQQIRSVSSWPSRLGLAVVVACLAAGLSAQEALDSAAEQAASAPAVNAQSNQQTAVPRSAHEAFAAGHYEQAVAGFSRRAAKRPDDAKAQFNLGSALHQITDYDGAKAAFEKALTSDQKSLRAKALYDLGNTAYRQGRLEEAIERYDETLALMPEDEDAKHNLEFVKRELERRQQQSEQRQQQNQQQNQDSSDNQDSDGEGQQQNQDGQNESQQQQDSDGDGLSDQQEREAENPTDPNRADSDGDGRSDGEEDTNRNGKVDPGESNPNRPDEPPEAPKDGPTEPSDAEQQEGEQPVPQTSSLTPEQAQRLLAALQDRRPAGDRKLPEGAKKARSAKDW